MSEKGAVIDRLRDAVPDRIVDLRQGRDISGWAREIWEVDKYYIIEMLQDPDPDRRELARYAMLQCPEIPPGWSSRERDKIAAIEAQVKTLIAYIEAWERAPVVIRGGPLEELKYKVKVLQKVAASFDSIRGQSTLKQKWKNVEMREARAAGKIGIDPDPAEPEPPRAAPLTEEELAHALKEIEAGAAGIAQGILDKATEALNALEAEARPEEPQEWTSQPGPEPPKKTLSELEELVEQFRPAAITLAGSMNHAAPPVLPDELMTPGRERKIYRHKGESLQEAEARAQRRAEEAARPKRPYNRKQKPVFIEVKRPPDQTETN